MNRIENWGGGVDERKHLHLPNLFTGKEVKPASRIPPQEEALHPFGSRDGHPNAPKLAGLWFYLQVPHQSRKEPGVKRIKAAFRGQTKCQRKKRGRIKAGLERGEWTARGWNCLAHFIFLSARKQSQVPGLIITPGSPPFRETKADGGPCGRPCAIPPVSRRTTSTGLRTDAIVLLGLPLIGPAALRVLPESLTTVECDQTARVENGAQPQGGANGAASIHQPGVSPAEAAFSSSEVPPPPASTVMNWSRENSFPPFRSLQEPLDLRWF